MLDKISSAGYNIRCGWSEGNSYKVRTKSVRRIIAEAKTHSDRQHRLTKISLRSRLADLITWTPPVAAHNQSFCLPAYNWRDRRTTVRILPHSRTTKKRPILLGTTWTGLAKLRLHHLVLQNALDRAFTVQHSRLLTPSASLTATIEHLVSDVSVWNSRTIRSSLSTKVSANTTHGRQ